MKNTKIIAENARNASYKMSSVATNKKNIALEAIASALVRGQDKIIAANESDLNQAKSNELAPPLLKRLLFDEDKIKASATGIKSLIQLDDPVGHTLLSTELDTGLELYRVSCPIGVIGVIFESRPDALVQISALALKSGNAILLKGGSEAKNTNRVLADLIEKASLEAGIPEGWIGLLETRDDVKQILSMEDDIDLLIPRGSNDFVRYIMEHTHIPVLGHADGVCHVYIDQDADKKMAIDLAVDSKTQYTAVCNAAETILLHADMTDDILPDLAEALAAKGVEIFGCEQICGRLGCKPATDWHHEYLDYKISIKIVDNLETAINHINTYGSGHTETIVTDNKTSALRFMNYVDSGNVFWNASTRFSDGFRYGFGAEVGISTSKIHARGPVGLEGLMTYQYRLFGSGQIVADYAEGKKTFTHRKLQQQQPES